ncbi:MAG: cytochrome oxidase subunit III [Bacteroidetes bacterium 43-93]|nr:cytochrome c oxidase subunit 3 [Bacteroidota bacterium]OJW98133.1 MAG: cytochrome oxidase subunit III [Bacteroidetes bacterium 43-93]
MQEGIVSPVKERRKIHPHKFALWIAMGSIAMMFAGLTSAYMVREAQGNWHYFKLPPIFWVSTVAIFASSITIIFGLKAFKERRMTAYRAFITTTLLLGVLFGILQYEGFVQLYANNIRIDGNPADSFIFIIAGLHLLHILGGIIALLIVFFRAFRKRVKVYNTTGLEIVASYWHFVDVLWIYLFVFFLVNQ